MTFWNLADALILGALALCVVVWPTQWISDFQNSWLRVTAVGLTGLQLVLEGPRLPLIGAYTVAGLFALLFIPRGDDRNEASSVRESKEGSTKKMSRWAMVIFSVACLALSIVWCLLSPRNG